jgi:hypothetical protein
MMQHVQVLAPHSLNVYVIVNSQFVKLLKLYTMKTLKLLFLTLFTVISVNVFSQAQVFVTNTSGPNMCDGTATLDCTNVDTLSIIWQQIAQLPDIIPSAFPFALLCAGNYSVTYNTTSGYQDTLFFTILEGVPSPCQGYELNMSTTNSLDSITCDGSATVTVINGLAPFSYNWIGIGTLTTNTVTNVCPGAYYCEVTDANGCIDVTYGDVLDASQLTGDTLVINGGSGCSPSVGTSTATLEDCFLDFYSVDTAFISLINYPSNPMDSLMVVWSVVDSTGMTMSNYTVYYPGLGMGCNELQFILYCFQKSSTIHTIVMTSAVSVSYSGIEELSDNSKQLIGVSDLMGRSCSLESGKIQILYYNDGTTEKRFVHE